MAGSDWRSRRIKLKSKWVINFYVNRKHNARKEGAAADSMEGMKMSVKQIIVGGTYRSKRCKD